MDGWRLVHIDGDEWELTNETGVGADIVDANGGPWGSVTFVDTGEWSRKRIDAAETVRITVDEAVPQFLLRWLDNGELKSTYMHVVR